MRIRTITELQQLDTFEERFDYLCLDGVVGDRTFGSERWINQRFYRSDEWRQLRHHIIVRDFGMDLGSKDVPIRGKTIIHHMNPLVVEDIVHSTDNLMDPEFLIATSLKTHNAIHYGGGKAPPTAFPERFAGDTTPWRRAR